MVLTTFVWLTVIPGLLTVTVAPEAKLDPVRVTFTVLPADPTFGLIEVSVGAAELIVNARAAVAAPPWLVTMTLAEPEALAEIVNVALI